MNDWYKELQDAMEVEIIDTEDDIATQTAEVIEELKEEVIEDSVNNQGWGHSKNPAPIWYNNVRHRAWYEPLFTAVCIRRKALYLPLPLALYGTKRIEPDALIIKDGIVQLIELDGMSHEMELASTEQNRLQPFRDNLIDVMRFPVSEDADINWANWILDQVFERIDKRKSLYGGVK